jgi:hypothetical protein
MRRTGRSSSGAVAIALGQVLVGIAVVSLAGEFFLVGLDRQRADAASQR